jgi:diaphanous 1
MPDIPLIVPTALTNGSLRFAEVPPDGTVQDVINVLTALDDVRLEILGGLDARGWALQRIRAEASGRQWQEHELNALGDSQFI